MNIVLTKIEPQFFILFFEVFFFRLYMRPPSFCSNRYMIVQLLSLDRHPGRTWGFYQPSVMSTYHHEVQVDRDRPRDGRRLGPTCQRPVCTLRVAQLHTPKPRHGGRCGFAVGWSQQSLWCNNTASIECEEPVVNGTVVGEESAFEFVLEFEQDETAETERIQSLSLQVNLPTFLCLFLNKRTDAMTRVPCCYPSSDLDSHTCKACLQDIQTTMSAFVINFIL